jgi:hypothetical protein
MMGSVPFRARIFSLAIHKNQLLSLLPYPSLHWDKAVGA